MKDSKNGQSDYYHGKATMDNWKAAKAALDKMKQEVKQKKSKMEDKEIIQFFTEGKRDEFLLKILAMRCYIENTTICLENNDKVFSFYEVKDSTIQGIKAFFANPQITPEEQHKLWFNSKIEEGWVYGEDKNLENKTHPCLIAYENLPEVQKKKDKAFQEILKPYVDLYNNA